MKAAILLSEDEEMWELACYHFHQAAEKALKGFLTALGERVPRTHDLGDLARRCAEHDADFASLGDDALLLNPFYIEARYPVLNALDLTSDRVTKAGEAAQRILARVQSKLA
ncbi:MAG: HEPN domain-containing protein [Chloroflexi bacterium]|nr:HEPN domain-containing protein [Chloroflexota bacterium]